MRRKIGSDVLKLLFVVFLLSLLPASIVWYRNRPYYAETADELSFQVFSHERSNIEAELGQRDSRFVTEKEALSRWRTLKQSVLDQGATQAEANKVLLTARWWQTTDNNYKSIPHWPILFRRGYVKDREVWFFVCAIKADASFNPEIVTGWDYSVLVIDPKTPEKHWGTYATNHTFPRCEGPNTPFPVHL